jgi:hypothetical protein
MIETEKIKFVIGLSGTYWGDKTPEYSIAISGKEYVRGHIKAESGVTELIEFEAELVEGEHRLEVGFLNKDATTDVIKNSDDTVAKDILLNVESVEIDDIDLGHLRYSTSTYELVKKQVYQGNIVKEIPNCVNLGFNGTYMITFSSPFYLWLLENL